MGLLDDDNARLENLKQAINAGRITWLPPRQSRQRATFRLAEIPGSPSSTELSELSELSSSSRASSELSDLLQSKICACNGVRIVILTDFLPSSSPRHTTTYYRAS